MKTNIVKSNLIFIFPGCIGGVTSFYRNIINHTTIREQVYIRVILLNSKEDKRPKTIERIDADEIQEFAFSIFENQYYVLKRLGDLIGSDDACIITDNIYPLNAYKFFKGKKSVVYLVHDYFYIRGAQQFYNVIDRIIVHSKFFKDVLVSASHQKFFSKTIYLPYGVSLPSKKWIKSDLNDSLRLVFLGRLTKEKGVFLLKMIDDDLVSKGFEFRWTIIGQGPCENDLKRQWSNNTRVSFIKATDSAQIFDILEKQDILVFPSWFEGTPVAIVEAMSRGVIPVVSDLPGGTRDLVTEKMGFLCNSMNSKDFADAIINLYNDKTLFDTLRKNCIQKITADYSIVNASNNYINHIKDCSPHEILTEGFRLLNLSRLDNVFLPNKLVYFIRSLMHSLKK